MLEQEAAGTLAAPEGPLGMGDYMPRAVFVQPFTHLCDTAAAWLLLPELGIVLRLPSLFVFFLVGSVVLHL